MMTLGIIPVARCLHRCAAIWANINERHNRHSLPATVMAQGLSHKSNSNLRHSRAHTQVRISHFPFPVNSPRQADDTPSSRRIPAAAPPKDIIDQNGTQLGATGSSFIRMYVVRFHRNEGGRPANSDRPQFLKGLSDSRTSCNVLCGGFGVRLSFECYRDRLFSCQRR